MIVLYKWEKIRYHKEWKIVFPVRKKKQQSKNNNFRVISLIYDWSWQKNAIKEQRFFCSVFINLTVERSPAKRSTDTNNMGEVLMYC